MFQREIFPDWQRKRNTHAHTHTYTTGDLSPFMEIFLNKGNNPSDWHRLEKLCTFTLKRKQRENCIPCHESETNWEAEIEKKKGSMSRANVPKWLEFINLHVQSQKFWITCGHSINREKQLTQVSWLFTYRSWHPMVKFWRPTITNSIRGNPSSPTFMSYLNRTGTFYVFISLMLRTRRL